MALTLNQVLGIILTVAAVVAVTFLVLFLNQLRRTAREGEKTLVKAQETMDGMKAIEAKIDASLDNVGEVLTVSKKAVSGLSEIAFFVTSKVIRPSARYWPFLFPLVRLGLQQLKKRKEKKDG
jgi:mannitol-specific phosphotransferase system IIBC component